MMIVSFAFCNTVKEYTPGTPSVCETTVTVEGEFAAQVKKELEEQLAQQTDDRLPRPFTDNFFQKTLAKAPLLDNAGVQHTGYAEGPKHSLLITVLAVRPPE